MYNDEWWNPESGRFYTSILEGGGFDTTRIPLLQILPLYYGIVEPGDARSTLLDDLAPGELVEVNVYLAETYYRAGRPEEAFRALMAQLDPDLPRREYPENPFTAVGTTIRFLVGLDPRASEGVLETRPRLPNAVDWVEVQHVPVLANVVTVRQVGITSTSLLNESGNTLDWRVVLPGRHEHLAVDGVNRAARARRTEWGEWESWITVPVRPSSIRTVTPPATS